MSEFDFSEGATRLSAAMTTGVTEVPFIAQMHEFAMRESGIPGDEFYTNGKKFVRVSTDNLIVSPALKDLGVHDQGFFEICKSCAVYYPDEFVFNG